METFIQSTSDLLEAFPGATVLITYSNVSKKTKSEDAKRASNVLKFKVYDSHLGKCIKYSTHKSKELSRLLTFLGPHGVSMKRKHDGGDVSEKKQKLGVGAASVMSNVKVEETEHETVESNAATPAPEEGSTATSSKKKKKKGKKK
ncbi:CIC11C00000002804 [Sungouiella intermedia]|uniref:CIC11C00000002804 n=1 Tax=Sungouiella intermedia TaxID=45354 RepID=A0A1L0BDN9_9ASCO|nr:CIC11C00000003790 [[Candida] intermedia]SGZ52848.1 CIC11C00000002804 [[Candida] intermedia]